MPKNNITLYYIDANYEGWDDCCIGLFDDKGKVIQIIDVYHGDKLPGDILRILGYKLVRVSLYDLVPEDEVVDSSCTNELPSHERVLKELPKWIKNNSGVKK